MIESPNDVLVKRQVKTSNRRVSHEVQPFPTTVEGRQYGTRVFRIWHSYMYARASRSRDADVVYTTVTDRYCTGKKTPDR